MFFTFPTGALPGYTAYADLSSDDDDDAYPIQSLNHPNTINSQTQQLCYL